MIAAMANNRIIGKDNQMPWHLPADFQWFKKCTLGKPVVMGRKTYESIGRPLPGRQNIVVSRNSELVIDGVECVTSLESAIALCKEQTEIMIIGGGAFYRDCLPLAQRLYITDIKAEIEGDTQFPKWIDSEWDRQEIESYAADEKNAYDMTFSILTRK
jgi:dihydrofolate reductase